MNHHNIWTPVLAVALLAACTTTGPSQPAPVPATTEPAKPVCPPESVERHCQSEALQAWMADRDIDVGQARAFDAKIAQNKLPVQSEIVKTAVRNERGQLVVLEVWKGTFMGLPPRQLARPGPALSKSVEEAAAFAASRTEPMRLIVAVSARDKARLTQWINAGIQRTSFASKPDIRWLTLKKGDLPFLRIEPLDPKQYSFGGR